MKKHKKKSFSIDRNRALACRPRRLPLVNQEKKENKLLLSVELERPRWQRILGAEKLCKRTFALDEYGQQVYEMCDGENSVRKIVRKISKQHNISISEAEVAVTTYMKTLIGKGLLAMEMDMEKKEYSRK